MKETKIYGILPVSTSKSHDTIYNKQMIIAEYIIEEINNSKVTVNLNKIIPITGTISQANSRIYAFGISDDNIIYLAEIRDNVDDLNIGEGPNQKVIFFKTFELAKLAKYVYMDKIKDHFQVFVNTLINTMEKNLPKNLQNEIDEIYNQYPEYLI